MTRAYRFLSLAASLAILCMPTVAAQEAPSGDPANAPVPRTASLEVRSQVGHAFALTIDAVSLPKAGYVVVYAFDSRGRLVNAPLGSLALEAGSYENVEVPMRLALLERRDYIDAPKELLVRLHQDDGDGRFFYRVAGSGDVPFVRAGVEVQRHATYQQGAVLSVLDQTLTNGAMTVASVYVPKPALLVVQAAGSGTQADEGAVLGTTSLAAGQHRYVRVPLDPAALEAAGYGDEARVASLRVLPDEGDGRRTEAAVTAPPPGWAAATAEPSIALPVAGVPALATDGTLRLELSADGMAVRFTDVTLTQTTFVVVHAVDANGEVIDSPAIGRAGRRNAGHYRNLVVRIPDGQAPVIGDQVVVLFHLDDGDGGYRYPASDPPAEVDGRQVAYPMTLR